MANKKVDKQVINQGLIQKEKKRKEFENEVRIVFGKDNMEKYNEWYLKSHPRSKKAPISSPIPILLNAFIAKVRLAQNSEKQKFHDYAMWVFRELNLPKLMLEECEVEYHATFPTKTRRDNDGICLSSKFIGDSLTEWGMWEDDDYLHIKRLIFSSGYEKGIRKIEVIIRY
ncbi:MAG: hypothetical protein ACRC1P_10880 [Cellulosilyticaceae bacterium]